LKLSQLLNDVPLLEDHIGQDIEITSLSCDTRTMKAGACYVALSGFHWDGNDFISEALEKGAVAVLCATRPAMDGPFLIVEDTRAALAKLSANWFGHPSKEMTILGVTGTNGKTTTTYLLKAMLEKVLEAKVGLIGTNQNMIGDEVLPAIRTTPEAYDLHELFRTMADAGCTHVVMEVSSHALMLHRVDGISFKTAIFTNLTQDHLDFHGTMERYRDAKGRLFQQCETGIFNLDDEAGRWYMETSPCACFAYSENKPEADLLAENIRLLSDHVEFEALILGGICRVRLPIPGGFTIYNALGVIACGLVLGIPLAEIAASLENASGVKGRVEVVPTPAAYTVLIDYAHTPDALENILLTARDLTEKRLICLFGCGGDRDRSKRPIMGEVAASLADLVFLTSDNPRTELPEAIMADVEAGFPTGFQTLRKIADRRSAIHAALAEAAPGDVIVLAGKGHETYQEVGTSRNHFDEREEIAAFFQTVDEK
jgi:UDP-N-acetylmuramoyl-L-alanyl-D-glutamate--2,6-diaminopimelate ligase